MSPSWVVIATVVLAGPAATSGLSPTADSAAPDTPLLYHPPIRITSDLDFLLPTSGVLGGDGSAEHPYLIENWLLLPMRVRASAGAQDACASYSVGGSGGVPLVTPPGPVNPSWMHGLEIRGTTKHVVIRNVHVRGIDPTSSDPIDLTLSQIHDSKFVAGIYLENARNVTIESSQFNNLYRGICARNVVDLRVANATMLDTFWRAISVIVGSNVALENSVIRRSGPGPMVIAQGSGFFGDRVSGLVVAGNDLSNNVGGVSLGDSHRAIIERNTISDSMSGIILSFSADARIMKNNILRNEEGIHTGNVFPLPTLNASIHQNNFILNQAGILNGNAVPLDARENWWNCPEGPRPWSSNPACDLVDGSASFVAVSPWLTEPVADAGNA